MEPKYPYKTVYPDENDLLITGKSVIMMNVQKYVNKTIMMQDLDLLDTEGFRNPVKQMRVKSLTW